MVKFKEKEYRLSISSVRHPLPLMGNEWQDPSGASDFLWLDSRVASSVVVLVPPRTLLNEQTAKKRTQRDWSAAQTADSQ